MGVLGLLDPKTFSLIPKPFRYLKKALEYARSNVSPAAVCGYLSWALR